MALFLCFVQSRCEWLTLLHSNMPAAEFRVEMDKTFAVIMKQASANKNITPETASLCIGMVSKCMGEEAADKLTASMKELVNVAAPFNSESEHLEGINLTATKLNQPASLQTAVCWHKYLTASLCKLYSSSAEMDEKIHATAMHMQHLGMKHPAEKKAAYGAGLIHFTTDGFLMDQVAELVIGRKIKEMLRQRWALATWSEMQGPSEYPPSTETFKVEYPKLYDAAFGQDLAAVCPIPEDKLMMIRNNTPCRSTKRGVIIDTQQQATHSKHPRAGTAAFRLVVGLVLAG